MFLPVISSLQTFCVYLKSWFLIFFFFFQLSYLLKSEPGFLRNSEVTASHEEALPSEAISSQGWQSHTGCVTTPWLWAFPPCCQSLVVLSMLTDGSRETTGNLQSSSWHCQQISHLEPPKLQWPLLVLNHDLLQIPGEGIWDHSWLCISRMEAPASADFLNKFSCVSQ